MTPHLHRIELVADRLQLPRLLELPLIQPSLQPIHPRAVSGIVRNIDHNASHNPGASGTIARLVADEVVATSSGIVRIQHKHHLVHEAAPDALTEGFGLHKDLDLTTYLYMPRMSL